MLALEPKTELYLRIFSLTSHPRHTDRIGAWIPRSWRLYVEATANLLRSTWLTRLCAGPDPKLNTCKRCRNVANSSTNHGRQNYSMTAGGYRRRLVWWTSRLAHAAYVSSEPNWGQNPRLQNGIAATTASSAYVLIVLQSLRSFLTSQPRREIDTCSHLRERSVETEVRCWRKPSLTWFASGFAPVSSNPFLNG